MELLIYTSYFIDPSVLCEGDLLDTWLRKVHTWLWTKDKIQEKKPPTLHFYSTFHSQFYSKVASLMDKA